MHYNTISYFLITLQPVKMEHKGTIAFHTLGCKLNFSETSTIVRMFLDHGFSKVEFGMPADVVVINTCTVTDVADKKCRQAIKKAVKTSPDGIVAVIGCYAQVKPESINEIDGVDIILDAKDKFKLLDFVENKKQHKTVYSGNVLEIDEFNAAWSFGDRTRTFMKVQDGCDYHCAYCTVPLARGKSRNSSIADTLKTAEEIASKGVKEIILTGINLGDFGKTTGENFLDLIRKIEKVMGIERYRISSIEPNLLTDEIILFVAQSGKFMPHFHIPLQSGCDKILQLMGRRYDRNLFENRIINIKKLIPDCFIGVDVIVGVPGETEEDFKITYDFLEKMDISELHVFSYSERNNTRAANFTSKVSSSERKERSKRLHDLSAQKLISFYNHYIGTEFNVLFEDYNDKGIMYGFTENYIKTETVFESSLTNTIRKVKLKGISPKGNMLIEL